MASSAAEPPSTRAEPLQIGGRGAFVRARDGVERWLEAERDQIALWLPVMLGAGIAAWFVLPNERSWVLALLLFGAAAFGAAGIGRGGRAARAILIAGLAAALGLASVWWRAEHAGGVVLTRATIATFEARVESIQPLPARELVRLRLAPTRVLDVGTGRKATALPAFVRVNLAEADVPKGLTRGAVIALRARLMPPPQPAVPGAYDYARVAWFDRIGGTGRGFAPVKIVAAGEAEGAALRQRLSTHIENSLGGSAGGIASALATGDEGAISEEDADAMRRSGLAHLLSVSGLHITAVVAATMLVVVRLLALSPWLALRFRLPLIAAGAGAAAAIGYTLLTGSQVPTIRSCVAALLVLVALALGREAMTLRLVAAGAVIVLLLWPEALAGPSFQLSFAAITAIVALNEHPGIKTLVMARDEPRVKRFGRAIGALVLTGLAVEIALLPIGLYHFHKAGLYGVAANIVAIPLTTFVIMPLEALALALDFFGLGAPFWWLTGKALTILLWIARTTAQAPGSVAALPAMPAGAFAAMVVGGLWIALWRTRWRRLGLAPLGFGIVWAMMTPAPDLLVTGDGRHLAVRTADGGVAMLRDRAGDYISDTLAENGGVDGVPMLLSERPEARCSRDLCLIERQAGGRTWRILATRSLYLVPIQELIAACGAADIVVSERRLPRACRPRWLRLDRNMLARTGGVAITLSRQDVDSVVRPGDRHPWRVAVADGRPSGSFGKVRFSGGRWHRRTVRRDAE
ncbi:ComEC/Rec2 family competence protein [Sphingomonas sp. Leaf357]|uniref:ComEC/Rec2 family competence protein n=1 Tax=Sphingomonas sp. Leaf357 TaxID=1736350 RepID=UPI00191C071C|nr:ComEC/Rec2 family competence protein [Sphingomonas sp. Leaf357]